MANFDRHQQKLEAGEQDVRQQLGATQAHLVHAASSLGNQTRGLAAGLEQAQHVLASESDMNSRRAQQLNSRTAAIEASVEAASCSNDLGLNTGQQWIGNDWSWINQDWWPRNQNQEPPPLPEPGRVDTEARTVPNPMATMFANVQISDPPRFDANRFEIFRRELLRWKDIHHSIADKSLIDVLAIRSKDDLLKSILTTFMENTREDLARRTFPELLKILDTVLSKEACEVALVKMSLWADFPRKNAETLRQFWQRHSRFIASMQKSGIELPNKIVPHKALSAMKLGSSQIRILLGALENQHMEESLKDLKRLSVKLSERNFIGPDGRILMVDEDGSNVSLSESGADSTGEEQVETFLTDEGECFEIRKIPIPKKKGPRGKFANAISSSIRSYHVANSNPNASNMNAAALIGKGSDGTGKANMECWRCGSTSHGWKQCHLPWQKTLEFGSARKAKASANASVKMADQVAMALSSIVEEAAADSSVVRGEEASPEGGGGPCVISRTGEII